jgi:hypothetical protein
LRNRFVQAAILLAAISFGMVGCAQQHERIPTVQIDVDEERVDVVDHYLEIDRRALVGVDKALAAKALDGDGPTAVAIGNAFADANHITEARFWYRIAAENGSAIGMNNFSIAAAEFNCRRSIFWLKKAIAESTLGAEIRVEMQRELAEATATCK